MNRNVKIVTFYNSKMALDEVVKENYSMSPNKPKLFIEFLKNKKFDKHLEIVSNFEPFNEIDFEIAHTKEYVNAVFNGVKPKCESSGLKWSNNFLETLTYTNSSLYNAIKYSIQKPQNICLSPTSGFHHAKPNNGSAFCTFSGQVIASLKIYKEFGLSGAYLDLDGHYGNSIEDSRKFCNELNNATPIGCNINPIYTHKSYLQDLEFRLALLRERIIKNEIHYIVHCKGADSHYLDDMRGQLTTNEWLQASKIVYNFVKETSKTINKPIPLTICLFGGYRKKAFEKVLNLHYQDLQICKSIF